MSTSLQQLIQKTRCSLQMRIQKSFTVFNNQSKTFLQTSTANARTSSEHSHALYTCTRMASAHSNALYTCVHTGRPHTPMPSTLAQAWNPHTHKPSTLVYTHGIRTLTCPLHLQTQSTTGGRAPPTKAGFLRQKPPARRPSRQPPHPYLPQKQTSPRLRGLSQTATP